jgi:hypothetical protein
MNGTVPLKWQALAAASRDYEQSSQNNPSLGLHEHRQIEGVRSLSNPNLRRNVATEEMRS